MRQLLAHTIGTTIRVRTLLAPALWPALVDPTQIEVAILNLAINARDAMPQGGTVTIETDNLLGHSYLLPDGIAARDCIRVSVRDTGTGMTEEVARSAIEPFFTTKEAGKGTGLGLATVFGSVKQSGGHIWVYSEPGHGTTFKVYLPRVEGTVAVRPSDRPAPQSGRGNETILLVDDDDQVRVVARGILRRCGYVVLEASNGGEALLISEQHTAKIHLLLTDVVMPRMSGRQIAERVATMRSGIKVLFMSGYTDEAVLHHGILESDVAYLQKPITPDTLTRKVRQVLDSNGGKSG
jgi:CheY-like chemotaxis protein